MPVSRSGGLAAVSLFCTAAAIVLVLAACSAHRPPGDETPLTLHQQSRLDELERMGVGGLLQSVGAEGGVDVLKRLDDYERRRIGVIDTYFDTELLGPVEPPGDLAGMLGVGLRAPVVYVLGLLDDPADPAQNPLTEATTLDQGAIAAEAGTLCAARAEAQRRAQQADLSIELDTPMEVGRDYQVTLIMQGRTGEQAAGELRDLQTAVPAPTALAETVWVSEELHAQLSTADFKVAELKGGWQTVVPEAATLWTWTVTPLSEGQKSLLFILEQRITTANSSYVVPVRNYPRRIAVQVSPMQIIYSTGSLILDNMVATVLALCTVAGGLLALLDLLARRRKSQLEKLAAAAAPIVEAVASTEVASPAAAEKPRNRKPTNTPAAKE